tara:strand:+ start:1380 stop:2075 length:696 start_codon:yes stop_codon:yes gene_type:complete
MREIFLNEPELKYVELIRIALSEDDAELRASAIRNVKHDVIAGRLELLFKQAEQGAIADPLNAEFMHWVAISSSQRNEAAYEFFETSKRYESKNEAKLNIAEETGFLIFSSVQDRKFKGIYTRGGIFEQLREVAVQEGVRGVKDKDVLRKLWQTYKGVVHLGMAIKYLEENPDHHFDLLSLAELFRTTLSENCPRGTLKPYVDPKDQFSFVYLSSIWGPRFGNRGLSYAVD